MAEEIKTSVPLIDRVIELQPARLIDIEGYTFIDKDKTASMFKPPVPSAIEIHTLSGFVGLLEQNVEKFGTTDGLNFVVHVESFDEVSLIATSSDVFGRRAQPVKVKALRPERQFAFNQYHAQEEFVIALRSLFVQTPELDAVAELAGNLAKQSEVRQEDDGFTQRVTAKDGVVRLKEITVKPRVSLQPFRTFLEVDQPAGEYIFRIQHDERRGNLCALFEADGGLWKLRAMDLVRAWLRTNLAGSSVAGVSDLQVIA